MMGICSRVFIFDEFNWNYANCSRSIIKEEVKVIIPHAVLEADIPYLMIFDIDKSSPQDLSGKITCDAIYFTSDNNHLELVLLE